MTDTKREESTPDQLLDTFRGSSLKSIILVTVVVHAVLLLGTSVPYLTKAFASSDTSKLSDKERLDIASKEVTSVMREIATKHGITPEALGDHFAPRAAVPATKETKTEPEVKSPEPPTPEGTVPGEAPKPESTIEKEIKVKQDGPKLPGLDTEKDDLFK